MDQGSMFCTFPTETGKIVHIAGALKKGNIRSKVPILFANFRYIIALCLVMLQSEFNVVLSTVTKRFSTRPIEF